MPSREEKDRIDEQWQGLQPGWDPKDYEGERRMLYDLLEPGEDLGLLHPCAFEAWGSRHDRGIVVATGSHVILLNRGRLSKNSFHLTYSEIEGITEPEPGRVRISGPGDFSILGEDGELETVYVLDLQFAASEFSRFVRGHLLGDEESVAAAFSHILAPGEQVRHWAHCSAGQETIYHFPGSGGVGGYNPEYWTTRWYGSPALAVATEQRILFIDARDDEAVTDCLHGTVLAVEHAGGIEVRLVNKESQVYKVHFQREEDATPFVNILREHASAARQASPQPGIPAEWKLKHHIWDYRNNHGNERRKLGEMLDDDEHLEAMLWGTYWPERDPDDLHSGVIAATNRQLLFVSNGWSDKHVSQLPLDGIAGVSIEGGQLRVDPAPGYDGYLVDGLDDASRHDSREKGQVEEFVSCLRNLLTDPPGYVDTAEPLPDQEAPVPSSSRPSAAKRRRVAQHWQTRSGGWDTSDHRNEMALLCEILADDEEIERLVYGGWQEDIPGQEAIYGVIAATNHRLIYVYNGPHAVNVAEFPNRGVTSLEITKGRWGDRVITVGGGEARADWVIGNTSGDGQAFAFYAAVKRLTVDRQMPPEDPDSGSGREISAAIERRQRFAQIWQERSNNWRPSDYKNEQEKILEILDDGEEVEHLLQCYWKQDIEDDEEFEELKDQWGVIAETSKRLIYVYNGRGGLRLAVLPYNAIGSVRRRRGLIDCRVTIAVKGGGRKWIISNITNGAGRQLVDRVEDHTQLNTASQYASGKTQR